MHQHIVKDLAEQAGFDVKLLSAPYPGGWPREDMLALESFAELIVRECVRVSAPEDSYTDEWFKAKADAVAKIKQHFGIMS
jgi:hypothetical protein